jgi:transcriptional regulator with XRE-family HTH domain
MHMMDAHQKAVRDLVERMLAATGLDLTNLAEKAGLSASTLTRFMNGKAKHTLSAKTLQKLSEASGVPVTLGEPPDDARLTRLVAAYQTMGETARQALERIARELVSTAPALPPKAKGRAPPPRPFSGGRVKENGSGACVGNVRPLRTGAD